MTSHCIMSYCKRLYIFEIMIMCMDVSHNTNRVNLQVISFDNDNDKDISRIFRQAACLVVSSATQHSGQTGHICPSLEKFLACNENPRVFQRLVQCTVYTNICNLHFFVI